MSLFLFLVFIFPCPLPLAPAFTLGRAGTTVQCVWPFRHKMLLTVAATLPGTCFQDFLAQLMIHRQDGGSEVFADQRIRNQLWADASPEPVVQQHTVAVIMVSAFRTDEFFRTAELCFSHERYALSH